MEGKQSYLNLKIHKLLYLCNCPDSLLTADHNMCLQFEFGAPRVNQLFLN